MKPNLSIRYQTPVKSPPTFASLYIGEFFIGAATHQLLIKIGDRHAFHFDDDKVIDFMLSQEVIRCTVEITVK